jgi:hypothetical protein
MTEVFKTRVDVVVGLRFQSLLLDTIVWKGSPWLVGGRHPTENGKTQQVARLVRPKLFHFLRPQPPRPGEDYFLNVAVPRTILDGRPASKGAVEFECVTDPGIELPLPTTE